MHHNKRFRADEPLSINDAISRAGYLGKASANGEIDMLLLTVKERVDVLGHMGEEPNLLDKFSSLFKTACDLKENLDLKSANTIFASDNRMELPVVDKLRLYVRQAYKELYDDLIQKFVDTPIEMTQNRMIVTGTSGIGKSVFLVYFTIRLLAKCDNNNPPIVIFHARSGTSHKECYAFGGTSTFRAGSIKNFSGFLELPETWYLADSVPNPKLFRAKTIIAVSPNTLSSEINEYQDVSKDAPVTYYMAPWSLSELHACR